MSELRDSLQAAPVDVKVVLGRTRMALEDILNSEPGALVELERAAGQPVDILVNDTAFGKGELVVVGNHMAVRVTELHESES